MDLIANYPIIPGITFLIILGFFGYQIKIILKERQKTKTPKLPNIQGAGKAQPEKKTVIPVVQAPAKATVAQIKKKYNPVVQFLSVFVLLLVVVSTVGVFYVYKNQSVPFVPRASGPEPTSPIISQPARGSDDIPFDGAELPTPTTVSAISPTATPVLIAANTTPEPTNSASAPKTLPTLTKAPTVTPIPTATPTIIPASNTTPTKTPTTPTQPPSMTGAIVPTAASAARAATPTPVLIAKNSLTVTPGVSTSTAPSTLSPTTGTSITPKPTQSSIPDAGFPMYLGVFVIASLIFLTIGFVW